MTKTTFTKRRKNPYMTKSDIKYGSLSKSLEDFLELSKDDREEKYGKGKAKYYERIVKEIQGSFDDIVLAFYRLPPEYSKKIDLRLGLDLIRKEIMRQQSAKDQANYSITQASTGLNYVLTSLAYPDQLTRLFYDDFNKVQNWLVILENFNPEIKKMKS